MKYMTEKTYIPPETGWIVDYGILRMNGGKEMVVPIETIPASAMKTQEFKKCKFSFES